MESRVTYKSVGHEQHQQLQELQSSSARAMGSIPRGEGMNRCTSYSSSGSPWSLRRSSPARWPTECDSRRSSEHQQDPRDRLSRVFSVFRSVGHHRSSIRIWRTIRILATLRTRSPRNGTRSCGVTTDRRPVAPSSCPTNVLANSPASTAGVNVYPFSPPIRSGRFVCRVEHDEDASERTSPI